MNPGPPSVASQNVISGARRSFDASHSKGPPRISVARRRAGGPDLGSCLRRRRNSLVCVRVRQEQCRVSLRRARVQSDEFPDRGDACLLPLGRRRECPGHRADAGRHDRPAAAARLRQRVTEPLRPVDRRIRPHSLSDDADTQRLLEREQRERLRQRLHVRPVAPRPRRESGPEGGYARAAGGERGRGDGLSQQHRLHEPGRDGSERDGEGPEGRRDAAVERHDLRRPERARPEGDRRRRRVPRRRRHHGLEPLDGVHERPARPRVRLRHQQRFGRPVRDRHDGRAGRRARPWPRTRCRPARRRGSR